MDSLGPSFIAGAIAGYGVAIPVGAIAVLIIEASLRRGLRAGLAAGGGAATADGFYALVAALAGAAVAGLIGPIATELRAASVVVLVIIGGRGLLALLHRARTNARNLSEVPPSLRRTYLTILGLTIINPTTVVYFAALVLGLPTIGSGPAEKLAFVVGASAASLSWQWALAVVGSLFHRRLSDRFQLFASVIGYVIVLGFAANIARGLLSG